MDRFRADRRISSRRRFRKTRFESSSIVFSRIPALKRGSSPNKGQINSALMTGRPTRPCCKGRLRVGSPHPLGIKTVVLDTAPCVGRLGPEKSRSCELGVEAITHRERECGL